MQRDIRGALQALMRSALPTLRVVGLVYAGLSAIAGLVVVVAMALTPRAPILEQVTEPARQAVTTIVQPTSDMVGSLVAPVVSAPTLPPIVVTAAPKAPQFVDMTTLYVVIGSTPVREVAAPAPAPRIIYVMPTQVPAISDDTPDLSENQSDDQSIQDNPASDAVVMLAPTEMPLQQAAMVDTPRPLPTPVQVPTTPEQVRAQVDAANQAAIDAQKAQATQTKAQADAANQAAIDAQKHAATPQVMSDSVLTLPTATPDARIAAAKARALADAANQAAIDAAKAPRAKR